MTKVFFLIERLEPILSGLVLYVLIVLLSLELDLVSLARCLWRVFLVFWTYSPERWARPGFVARTNRGREWDRGVVVRRVMGLSLLGLHRFPLKLEWIHVRSRLSVRICLSCSQIVQKKYEKWTKYYTLITKKIFNFNIYVNYFIIHFLLR